MQRAIVIGAGPAGLAAAACLKKHGLEVQILERGDRVAQTWHGHYDRLHLHTSRGRSGLPYLALPGDYPKYPSRTDMIGFWETYARKFDLPPRFGCTVTEVRPRDGGWTVVTGDGEETADVVVFATGVNGTARKPSWPGMDSFPGRIVHSADYRNAEPFTGQKVLVVGFGNSGADIALDLVEGDAAVGLSVRGPVNLLPKEVLGVPVTSMGLVRKVFGPGAADVMTKPLVRALIGRPEDYGLQGSPKGPVRQVVEDGRVPMIDEGALASIKAGKIAVFQGIQSFDGSTVRFADGQVRDFDAVVLATGYALDLRSMLPDVADDLLDPTGRPRISGGPTGKPGLYFCSYHVSPNGQLPQAAAEAKAIAADVVAGRH